MGVRRRKNEAPHPAKRAGAAPRADRRPSWFLLVVAAAAVITAVVVLVKSGATRTPPPQASPTGTAAEAMPTTAPAAAQEGGPRVAAPTPERLVGKWQRTDGDYALDVRRVGAGGRAEVAYSNPDPINVSRAEVKQDADRLLLFVELRDVNYPGSTYLLAYQPGQDTLTGTYHQPALGQTYEVGFVRAE